MADAPGRSWKGRAALGLPWVVFSGVLLSLALCDLGVNPILDERHYVQGGLGAAANRFVRTGFSSGPAYLLALGILDAVVYVVGAASGFFLSSADFMAWHLGHPAPLFFVGRILTAATALGGLALLARALFPRIGAGWASLLCLGFVFTAPSLGRMAFATPHGCMVGISAALLAALVAASEGRSTRGWAAAGALASLGTCTMTIGLGLFVLPAWAAAFLPAESDGLRRGARFQRIALGAAAGLLAFGFPILLHPADYWQQNVRYQVDRQILSDAVGDGNVFLAWAVQGPTLWIFAFLGVWRAEQGRERTLAAGALLTALGYLSVLALLTRSQEASYSLAALPCLAFAASGLVPRARTLSTRLRFLVCVIVFALPAGYGSCYVFRRLTIPDPKTQAAEQMARLIPAGSVVLVDSWWGPRLSHRAILLAPYRNHVGEWMKDPAFVRRLEAGFPREHERWNVVVYPEEVETLDLDFLRRRGIAYAAVSESMMTRPPYASAWERFRQDGTLQDLEPAGTGPVRFFRVLP